MPLAAAAPIGIFDSGIGGLSVLNALRVELPDASFVYVADSGNAPYGERDEAFVIGRSLAVAAHLLERFGIGTLVVACNTATTAAIRAVRSAYPALQVVGVEPAVKPAAAATRTGRVGVIGTRGTLTSVRFQALLAPLRAQVEFVVQPCDGLALAIEQDGWNGAGAVSGMHDDPAALRSDAVAALCLRYTREMGRFGDAAGEIDTLVLGCTHYVFANDALRACVGPAVLLIDTGAAVARHTRRLLQANHAVSTHSAAAKLLPIGGDCSLKPMSQNGNLRLITTGSPDALYAAARRWVELDISWPEIL